MGCPTSYDGMSATWSKGKLSRLSSGTLASGTTNYTYSYNGCGQRVSKTYSFLEGTNGLNPVQTGQVINYSKQYYYDHAGRLIAETINKSYYNASATVEHIVYLYDENSIVGIDYTSNGATYRYFFQRNLQGDVTAIFNTSGTIMAKYLYDAWGNCTISSETTSYDVANTNPIRYRGYYYDDDTGLYYCNARYYSSKWRRFISPDDTAYLDPESVNGLNLYCYCNNDPVNLADPSGRFGIALTLLICTGIGLAFGAGTEMAMQAYNGGDWNWDLSTWNWWEIGKAGLLGAANGLAYGLGGVAGGILKGSFHALTIANKALTAYQSVSILLGTAMVTNFAAGIGGYAMYVAGSKEEHFNWAKGISWAMGQTAKSTLSFFTAGMYVGVGGWNVGDGAKNSLVSIVGRAAGRFISSYIPNNLCNTFFI